jgi:hypothetical protein
MTNRYLSGDGETEMVIDGSKASIMKTGTTEVLATVELRGEVVAAAISNNRRYVAAALQVMLGTDIYQYKQGSDGRWDMGMLERGLKVQPAKLTWEEGDDPRYPPVELKVTGGDGAARTVQQK